MFAELPVVGDFRSEDGVVRLLVAHIEVAVGKGVRTLLEFVSAVNEVPCHQLIGVREGLRIEIPPVVAVLKRKLESLKERQAVLNPCGSLYLRSLGHAVARVLRGIFGIADPGAGRTHGRGRHPVVRRGRIDIVGLRDEGQGEHESPGSGTAHGSVGVSKVAGLIVVLVHHTEVKADLEIVVGPCVDVGAEVCPLVVVAFHEASLVLESAGEEVVDFLAAAAYRHVVLVGKGCAQHGLDPVGVLYTVGSVTVGCRGNLRVGEKRNSVLKRYAGDPLIELITEIVVLHVLVAGHHLRKGGGMVDEEPARVLYAGRTFVAPLCGDEDDAVGAPHTVDGGRCVLEYGDRLDVGRVDLVHVALNSVDKHKHGTCVVVG